MAIAALEALQRRWDRLIQPDRIQLVIHRPGLGSRTVNLHGGVYRLGRDSDAEIPIDHGAVSRHHALLEQRGRDLVALGVFLDHFLVLENGFFIEFFEKEGFADPELSVVRIRGLGIVANQLFKTFPRRLVVAFIERRLCLGVKGLVR